MRKKLTFNLEKISDGFVELHYYPVVKSLFISKNYKVAIKNFNIYYLAPEVLYYSLEANPSSQYRKLLKLKEFLHKLNKRISLNKESLPVYSYFFVL